MRKRIITISSTILALAGGGLFAPAAHADAVSSVVSLSPGAISFGMIQFVIAGIANLVLYLASYWVTITGALFSVSINLTLHIKDFVDQTEGVYLVWQTIRDISGMFIIFMLLYASIRLILSKEEGGGGINSVGNLIKNIVIAGILINFSFFIVSLLIDASNIVSLALYKGIVSAPLDTQLNVTKLSDNILSGKDVGLSDIFLQHLQPQVIYDPANLKLSDTSSGAPAPLKTLVQGVVGVVIMFTVGMSFLLAAAAFVARLILLIILLAFSPIWFASWVIPQLEDRAKEFTKLLKGQLIFMPVYLLLLYAAMLIITKSTVFLNPASTSTGSATSWILGYIVLGINDFFIIFLLNLPLVVALKYAGASDKLTERFGAKGIWKNVGSFTGRRTLGRMAYAANESRAVGWLASRSPLAGGIVSKSLSNVSNAGFGVKKGGYTDVLEAKKKSQEKLSERIGKIDERLGTAYQEKYRANLPWKNSVMGRMLDNRANLETQKKLNKVADEKAKKAEGEAAEEKIRNIDKALKRLESGGDASPAEIESLNKAINDSSKKNEALKAFGLESSTAKQEQRLKEIGEKNQGKAELIKKLNEDREKQVSVRDAAKKIREAEKDEKMLSALKDLKDSQGSGGGGGGSDKPKDGDKK